MHIHAIVVHLDTGKYTRIYRELHTNAQGHWYVWYRKQQMPLILMRYAMPYAYLGLVKDGQVQPFENPGPWKTVEIG